VAILRLGSPYELGIEARFTSSGRETVVVQCMRADTSSHQEANVYSMELGSTIDVAELARPPA
jgi:hypothetical protein